MTTVRRLSLGAAIVSAVSTATFVAIGASRIGTPFEFDVLLLLSGVMLIGCLPYLVTAMFSGSARPLIRRWSAWALALYGAGDLLIRSQLFFFPQSSTHGVALATYPFLGALTMFSLAALMTAVLKNRST